MPVATKRHSPLSGERDPAGDQQRPLADAAGQPTEARGQQARRAAGRG